MVVSAGFVGFRGRFFGRKSTSAEWLGLTGRFASPCRGSVADSNPVVHSKCPGQRLVSGFATVLAFGRAHLELSAQPAFCGTICDVIISADGRPAKPGWYSNSEATHSLQWWNGDSWTNNHAPLDDQLLPFIRTRVHWTLRIRAVMSLTGIFGLGVGVALVRASLLDLDTPSVSRRILFAVAGVGVVLVVGLLPVWLRRSYYEVHPGSIISCTGYRTHRATKDEIKVIRLKYRQFGAGGPKWTAYVELKGRRGFWLRYVVAGSSQRALIPGSQERLDRISAILDFPPSR
jgi:hypothetical protein